MAPQQSRRKKTVRFSEHVDHGSISPTPRSASAPENSAAQGTTEPASRACPAAKPVPVQSSSSSEFLFLPRASTAQDAVPAGETQSRSEEEHHPSSENHHSSSDAHHHSMVHDASPCQAGCFESVAEVRSIIVRIVRRECGGALQVTVHEGLRMLSCHLTHFVASLYHRYSSCDFKLRACGKSRSWRRTLLCSCLTRRRRFRPPGGPGWFGVKLGPSCLPVKLVK